MNKLKGERLGAAYQRAERTRGQELLKPNKRSGQFLGTANEYSPDVPPFPPRADSPAWKP